MSVSSLRRGRATAPAEETGRLMECVECQELVRVYEIPHRWLDEHNYTCGQCMVAAAEKAGAA